MNPNNLLLELIHLNTVLMEPFQPQDISAVIIRPVVQMRNQKVRKVIFPI